MQAFRGAGHIVTTFATGAAEIERCALHFSDAPDGQGADAGPAARNITG